MQDAVVKKKVGERGLTIVTHGQRQEMAKKTEELSIKDEVEEQDKKNGSRRRCAERESSNLR